MIKHWKPTVCLKLNALHNVHFIVYAYLYCICACSDVQPLWPSFIPTAMAETERDASSLWRSGCWAAECFGRVFGYSAFSEAPLPALFFSILRHRSLSPTASVWCFAFGGSDISAPISASAFSVLVTVWLLFKVLPVESVMIMISIVF